MIVFVLTYCLYSPLLGVGLHCDARIGGVYANGEECHGRASRLYGGECIEMKVDPR